MPDARRPNLDELGSDGSEGDPVVADPLLSGSAHAPGDDDATGTGSMPRRGSPPNFLVRRAVFVAAVVVVIAVGAVVASRFLDDEPAGGDDETIGAAWNSLVVVTDDEVRVLDPDTDLGADDAGRDADDAGEVVHEGNDLLDVESVAVGSTLVMADEDGEVSQLDLVEGTVRRVQAEEGGVLVTDTGHPAVVAVGRPRGGELVIVDTRTGATVDVGELADLDDPVMFADELVVNRAGTHAAVADGRSFQTVVVDLQEESVTLLGGRVEDLDDATVVTAQPAGAQSELDFFELDGDRVGTVDAPTPEALVLTGDGAAVAVTGDGRILTVAPDGDLEEAGVLTDDDRPTVEVADGFPVLGRERILAVADGFVAVLDADGEIRSTVPGELLGGPGPSSRCVVVGSPDTGGESAQVDLETGEVVGRLPAGTVSATSVDGCTAAVVGTSAPQVLVRGEALTLPTEVGSLSAIAPDGGAAVGSTPDGETIVDLGSVDPRPRTLTEERAVVRFADVP